MLEKKNWIILLLSSLLTSVLSVVMYHVLFSTSIKYVQTDKLVYNFEGTKEYQAIYKKKVEQLKANVDSLELDFRQSVASYNTDYPKLNANERITREKLLQQQEDNLIKYKEGVQVQMSKEDDEMTGKALAQISDFVQDYGKKQGYTLILGTTNDGSILYGSEKHDITDELVKQLNLKYKGKVK